MSSVIAGARSLFVPLSLAALHSQDNPYLLNKLKKSPVCYCDILSSSKLHKKDTYLCRNYGFIYGLFVTVYKKKEGSNQYCLTLKHIHSSR